MLKFTGMCHVLLNHEEGDFRRQSLEFFFSPPKAQTLVCSEQIGMIQRNISFSDRGLSFIFFFISAGNDYSQQSY